MTVTFARTKTDEAAATDTRFRLNRAGILNVWQYDDQVFEFADGRMLLRGANGAGKSKTLEMLLPFALDGDKARITASAKHHTSLLWLMTDGFEGNARVGYIWVEFLRTSDSGQPEAFTCGIGIRASESQRTATAWHFATQRRIGHDLVLEDDAGPLSRGRLEEALGSDGQVFERATPYKEHVGRTLFGLDATQYDEVLRLLYWLRQPQVGEDIDPGKLAQHLSQALPQLDEQAIRKAGDTFDELVAFGEQIDRRAVAAEALKVLAGAYSDYARAVVAKRASRLAETLKTERNLRRQLRKAEADLQRVTAEREQADESLRRAAAATEAATARLRALEESPEARDQRRLTELAERASREDNEAQRSGGRVQRREKEHKRKSQALAEASDQVRDVVRTFTEELTDAAGRQQESVPGSTLVVPAHLRAPDLRTQDDANILRSELDDAFATIEQAGSAAGVRSAAVTAVLAATAQLETARGREKEARGRAADAESRWDDARQRRVESERAVERAEVDYRASLADWESRPEAVPLELPSEFTAETLDAIPELVRGAASGRLRSLRTELQSESTKRENAAHEIQALEARRREIEVERDPAPPQPALCRTARPDGHSLWEVIDFTADLDQPTRADLEAALQSSGLLDGWVRPGGRLLDPDLHDTLLAAHTPEGKPTLAAAFRVDLPDGSDLSVDDVQAVLDAIHFGEAPESEAAVAADGSWRLGPARGRATKPIPQYIGATARAQERARRLAEIDQELQSQRDIRDAASAAADQAQGNIQALEDWMRDRPSDTGLRGSWTRRSEHLEAEARDEQANRAAQREARNRHDETLEAHSALTRLAQEHDLPIDTDQLAALKERLQDLRAQLRTLGSRVPYLHRDLHRWSADATAVDEAFRDLTAEQADHTTAVERAERTEFELNALREAVGASAQELDRKIALAKEETTTNETATKKADNRVRELAEAFGEARTDLKTAQEHLESHAPARADALSAFEELSGVPGLLGAADVPSPEPFLQAGQVSGGTAVPDSIAQAARELANRSADEVTKAADRVWTAHRDAESGPAADHQPQLSRFGDLLAVTGQDDAGEAPVVTLAARVTAAVEHDRTLLTEREKEQFEQHILGELGDALRGRRRDADELVTAMNDLLGDVTTSQGIRLRLKWDLRDDIPNEARIAVDLLAQPVGALLPEERTSLRDALHGLIETSRALNPELSYREHLASSLDYRTWSEFTIRYTRPEKSGTWERLHRRSALSQGEQKVLCYLPLFAAAAAHFTSLAGAAPHAPRLVLLDDAFPKIDVKTHPLLFGLLVQLDLDFIITSERLWGCHEAVPSLAIYEALRDPNQRGIAQYESRWDGRTLRSIG